MKIHAKILTSIVYLCMCFVSAGAQLGSQGMRQQIASLTDICTTQFSVIESMLDLPSCAATPITTSTTLSIPGNYCLAHNIGGDVAITGTGITLDLAGRTISGGNFGIAISSDQVTVRNGTIANATQAAAYITANNCSLDGLNFMSSATGLYILNGTNNRVNNCCALHNTAAGFSLKHSTDNNFTGCIALAQSGQTPVYGFITTNGNNNTFASCEVKNCASSSAQAYGWYIADTNAALRSCQVYGVQSETAAHAYGIILPNTALTFDAGSSIASTIPTVDWSPDNQYLAVGLTSPYTPDVRVFAFTGTQLVLAASYPYNGATVFSVAWSPDGNHLAVGGGGALSGYELQVLAFTGTSLSLAATPTFTNEGTIHSVDWSPDGNYIAAGVQNPPSDNEIQVYTFGEPSLLLTATADYNTGGFVDSVNWAANGQYLAVGGDFPGYEVQVFSFSSPSSLSLTTTSTFGNNVHSVNWSPDGHYLATGGDKTGGNDIQVFAFTGTLSLVSSATFGGTGGFVDSLEWSPDGQYLAVGGDEPSLEKTIQIFSFEDAALSFVATYSFGFFVSALTWASNGIYLAAGGSGGVNGNNVQVYTFTPKASQCFIENNVVTGVHSSIGAMGIGYSLDACANLFIDNTAYNNDTDYGFSTTCSGENLWSHIDALESKLDFMESKLDACCTGLNSNIEWIVQYLMTH